MDDYPPGAGASAHIGRVSGAFEDQGVHAARKRYRYHDRGDGMYEAARALGGRPHLVKTGEHAGRSNVRYMGTYASKWDLHLWSRDFFTSVANVPFHWLFIAMTLAYTTSYFVWGIIWFIIAETSENCVEGFDEGGATDRPFLTAYIFSLETQATIGFGNRSVGICGSSAFFLTLQNVFGLILDAISLGIVFAKLSHPKHRGRSIFISESATIARRDGQLKFMFRVADVRAHTACSAKLSAYLFTWGDGRDTLEGEHIPVRVEPMELVNIQSLLLLPTVIEHVIDERSPLFHLGHDELVRRNAEVVVTFEAVSDFGDSFMVRQSYLNSEIHWGHTFVPITHKAVEGQLQHLVDLSRFHDVQPTGNLPQLPPSDLSRAVLQDGSALLPSSLPYPALGANTLAVSDKCVATTRDKVPHLSFRVGDTRPGQTLEVHARAYLYEWTARTTKEGEQLPYSVHEIDLGYSRGADRLLLRFPTVLSHAVASESPLSKWVSGKSSPSHAAELVIIVEGVLFSKSATISRTATLKLPQDLQKDRCFAPMVHAAETPAGTPSVDWHAFHTVIKPGEAWSPRVPQDLGAGQGTRREAQAAENGGTAGVSVQSVEMSARAATASQVDQAIAST